jgi:hypothetical protein
MSDSTDDLIMLAAFGIVGFLVYEMFVNPPKAGAGSSAAMQSGSSSLPNAATPYAQSPVASTTVFGPTNTGVDYSDFDSN